MRPPARARCASSMRRTGSADAPSPTSAILAVSDSTGSPPASKLRSSIRNAPSVTIGWPVCQRAARCPATVPATDCIAPSGGNTSPGWSPSGVKADRWQGETAADRSVADYIRPLQVDLRRERRGRRRRQHPSPALPFHAAGQCHGRDERLVDVVGERCQRKTNPGFGETAGHIDGRGQSRSWRPGRCRASPPASPPRANSPFRPPPRRLSPRQSPRRRRPADARYHRQSASAVSSGGCASSFAASSPAKSRASGPGSSPVTSTCSPATAISSKSRPSNCSGR